MLHLLFALLVLTAPVTDDAGVLTDADEKLLAAEVNRVAAAQHLQLAVLLVKTTGSQSIESYSLATANRWGAGQRGVLLVVALDDRRSRLEVADGLEDKLTQQISVTILDGMKPALREGRHKDALLGAVKQVDLVLAGRAAEAFPAAPIRPRRLHVFKSEGANDALLWATGIGLFVLLFYILIRRARRLNKGKTYRSATSSADTYTAVDYSSSSSSYDSSSSGGGGGSFSGGGASSSW
jgi:uncharacterized membrane protein YgcG